MINIDRMTDEEQYYNYTRGIMMNVMNDSAIKIQNDIKKMNKYCKDDEEILYWDNIIKERIKNITVKMYVPCDEKERDEYLMMKLQNEESEGDYDRY